ncbi:MAG: hypothetical protein C0617_14925 [Desulfuromonas sp.]|uniref:THUMP domain-containing class I SAM-dependent RNA methyltransferase n=1 Tax=Desulfuromonas sp. TaxID=892 RepID=UPI000CBE8700|nr:class I SAM-dependent RNA methyltransferase [Desulfuromonas sp.]PLX82399.1 MAG: hypothetical protein C0617_14925 [Desulfuromonas sp.]
MKRTTEELFAVTAPGLEEVCAGELSALGMEAVRAVPGGVEFSGGLREIYLANLWLRTASRVVVRLGQVKARDFPGLFQGGVRLPWGKFVRPGTRTRVRAASHASRLGHTGRIAATLADAADRALGRPGPPGDGPEQLVLARFQDDLCTLSVDSSGELLPRRGYREEGASAPLRETLAAGILLQLGWDGTRPLVDPMCGSGTFLVEAALIAGNRAPGARRVFAFQGWPRYRPGLWEALSTEAARAERNVEVALRGSDSDPGAVAAASRNAARAGVAQELELAVADLSSLKPSPGPGLVLCNPPYGERLERDSDLRPLFRTLGQVYRQAFGGWRGALLCPDRRLAEATGLTLAKRAALVNGGIRVALFTARL